MFPDVKFIGLDLYTWMLLLGIVAAIVLFRVFCDRRKLPPKVFNFSLLVGLGSILFGYLSAVLFQAFFSWMKTGVWDLEGATFAGGLAGAAAFFLALYFGIGHFLFKKKEHIYYLNTVVCCAFPCIVAAHAIGRLGCLFAGCCYGKLTDSWVGLPMYVDGEMQTRVPIQLFESLFLFALFGVLVYFLIARKSPFIVVYYLFAYGVWRFVIEFFRDDDRGASLLPFLSPSQTICILMILLGAGLLLFRLLWFGKYCKKLGETIEKGD